MLERRIVTYVCVDFRRLNAATPIDAYPMPRTDELLDKLDSAQCITTFDLAKGYWQVPMREEDRPKTALLPLVTIQGDAIWFEWGNHNFSTHDGSSEWKTLLVII